MYQEYSPCPLLAPYIDKYWEIKGETEYDIRYKILPDGCADFIFSIDHQMLQATRLIIRSNGMMPIRELTDQLYLGQRHFERKFKHTTGYTPKEFSRITKFRYATRVLRSIKDTDMQQLAIDCGYYDQSHFIKEFRKLSGSNPSAFISLPIPEDDPLTYLE